MKASPSSDTIPAQARGRERMADVLREAERMMVEEGYAGLTMRKLAERCGIALGNLQYYFPSKSDLVAALVETICERHTRALGGRLDMAASPKAALETTLRYMLEDIRKPEGSVLYWELWALAAHDEVAKSAIDGLYSAELQVLEQGVKRLNPELPPRTSRLRAQAIMAMVEGGTLLIGEGRPNARTPKPLMDEIVKAVFAIARSRT